MEKAVIPRFPFFFIQTNKDISHKVSLSAENMVRAELSSH